MVHRAQGTGDKDSLVPHPRGSSCDSRLTPASLLIQQSALRSAGVRMVCAGHGLSREEKGKCLCTDAGETVGEKSQELITVPGAEGGPGASARPVSTLLAAEQGNASLIHSNKDINFTNH